MTDTSCRHDDCTQPTYARDLCEAHYFQARRNGTLTPEPGEPCPQCDQVHARCTAHNRAGGPCGQQPAPNQNICRNHGARAPQNIAAANNRAELKANQAALEAGLWAAYGANPPKVDPAQALLDALRWKHAEVTALRMQVAALDPDDLTWGITREKTGGDDRGTTHEAKPNIWLGLLHTAEDQLVKFAKAAHDAGIQEREIALAEGQGRILAGAIQQILTLMHASVIALLSDNTSAVAAIEASWSGFVATHAPAVLRSLPATPEENR